MMDEAKQRKFQTDGDSEADVWHLRNDYVPNKECLNKDPPDGSSHTLFSSTEPGSSEEAVRLRRLLGVPHGVGIICGLIVGSGIYISPKGVVRETGSVGLSLIMWLVAGAKAAVGASVMSELGTTFPYSGGMYSYLSEMCGPFWGFLYGWMYVLMTRPGSNAVKCLIFGKYILQPFYQECEPPQASVTFIAVCLACMLNLITYISPDFSFITKYKIKNFFYLLHE